MERALRNTGAIFLDGTFCCMGVRLCVRKGHRRISVLVTAAHCFPAHEASRAVVRFHGRRETRLDPSLLYIHEYPLDVCIVGLRERPPTSCLLVSDCHDAFSPGDKVIVAAPGRAPLPRGRVCIASLSHLSVLSHA